MMLESGTHAKQIILPFQGCTVQLRAAGKYMCQSNNLSFSGMDCHVKSFLFRDVQPHAAGKFMNQANNLSYSGMDAMLNLSYSGMDAMLNLSYSGMDAMLNLSYSGMYSHVLLESTVHVPSK
jgi:tRNA A37 threonylcarbamoyltransferase TsaD